jgi:hypothetical protein
MLKILSFKLQIQGRVPPREPIGNHLQSTRDLLN